MRAFLCNPRTLADQEIYKSFIAKPIQHINLGGWEIIDAQEVPGSS